MNIFVFASVNGNDQYLGLVLWKMYSIVLFYLIFVIEINVHYLCTAYGIYTGYSAAQRRIYLVPDPLISSPAWILSNACMAITFKIVS
jgi:hypothetical protein